MVIISELIKRISVGDEEAFKLLFDAFHGKLFELARYYSRSDEIAEEVVNDVFLKVWIGRKKLSDIKKIESYLFIATKNQTLSYLRSNKKELAFMSINRVELNVKLQIPDAEKTLIDKELLHTFSESIRELPEKCGIVYRMVKEDDLSYKEVAKILNISLKAVEKHMGVAIKRIRNDINTYLSCDDIDYKNIIISAFLTLCFIFF